jgi:hypothetical protein
MKLCRLAAMAAAAYIAAAAVPALATNLEVVSGTNGARATTIPSVGPIGQSFTAFDSVLQSVGFQFELFNTGAANTAFTLSLVSGSTLTGPALYSKTFTVTSLSSAATWTDIALSDWAVTTGGQYTFILSNTSYRYGIALGPEVDLYTGVPKSGDAYTGGTALFTNTAYYGYDTSTNPATPYDFCKVKGICDLNFRITAITPAAAVPEPASWALMIAGLGFVGGAMRRSKARVAFA